MEILRLRSTPLLQKPQINYGSGKPGWLEIKWYTPASGLCR